MNNPIEISPEKIIEDAQGFSVVILPKRTLTSGLVVFFSFWLIMALYVTIVVSGKVFDTAEPTAGPFFYFIWFIPWAYGYFSILRFLLWDLKGEEVISVSKDALLITQNFWLFSQRKHFKKELIRKIRLNSGKKREANMFWFFPGKYGRIVFDYGDDQFRFGSMASGGEAERVLLFTKRKLKGK